MAHDEAGARAARRLIAACHRAPFPLQLLAIALGYTSGPEVKAVLEDLAGHRDAETATYARNSLTTRDLPPPVPPPVDSNMAKEAGRRYMKRQLGLMLLVALIFLALIFVAYLTH